MVPINIKSRKINFNMVDFITFIYDKPLIIDCFLITQYIIMNRSSNYALLRLMTLYHNE